MKRILMTDIQKRGLGLAVFCLVVFAWNSALAIRRTTFSGAMTKVVQRDTELKVNCPGRVEPKVQESIRSVVEGIKVALHVKEGDNVTKDQLLLEISDQKIRQELNQKRASFRNATTDYTKAQKDYRLERNLFRQGAVPQRDVDNAKQAFERAGQTLMAAQEDLIITERKAKGVNVMSPMTGTVVQIMVESDPYIAADKELMKIAKLDEFVLRGQVDELDIARLKVGQEASVVCDAFPGKVMRGDVNWIGAQAKSGAFAELEVTVEIRDTLGLNLKPNLSCEAQIITGTLLNAVVAPVSAVRRGPEGTFVLKSRFGGWLHKQEVEVAHVSAGTAIITSGLKPGDAILVPKGL